jgi:hypothetical protein
MRLRLSELPPGQMVEYGHFLPEPGMQNVWLAGLTDAERARIARVGECSGRGYDGQHAEQFTWLTTGCS